MIRFTDSEIEQLILDDAPLGDLTSALLGLHTQTGTLTVTAREELVACGTEEVERLLEKLRISVHQRVPSGTVCHVGDPLLSASGEVSAIHMAWRAGSTMIEFASGIATRTRQLVAASRRGNKATTVAGSRKHAPFLKKIALKALMAGGGVPHRTGLSDTVLIFKEHLLFLGGYEQLARTVERVRAQHRERMVVVEAHTELEALAVAQSGAHFVQIDKMPPPGFAKCARECKKVNPNVGVIAAGGINAQNARAYAEAGAEVLVTSWMYAASPADVKVTICADDGSDD
ncbi:MAG: ModD protein [Deltaproteobacteria bacterium]|nr:ModD protein [Deltaproteobacteria bacterium]